MRNLHRDNKIYQTPNNNFTDARRLVLASPAASRTRRWGLTTTAPATCAHALLAAIGIGARVAALLITANCTGVGRLRLSAVATVSGGLIVGACAGTVAARIVTGTIAPGVIVVPQVPGTVLVIAADIHVAVDVDFVAVAAPTVVIPAPRLLVVGPVVIRVVPGAIIVPVLVVMRIVAIPVVAVERIAARDVDVVLVHHVAAVPVASPSAATPSPAAATVVHRRADGHSDSK